MYSVHSCTISNCETTDDNFLHFQMYDTIKRFSKIFDSYSIYGFWKFHACIYIPVSQNSTSAETGW